MRQVIIKGPGSSGDQSASSSASQCFSLTMLVIQKRGQRLFGVLQLERLQTPNLERLQTPNVAGWNEPNRDEECSSFRADRRRLWRRFRDFTELPRGDWMLTRRPRAGL